MAEKSRNCGCPSGRRCECGMSEEYRRFSTLVAPICGECDSCLKNAKHLRDTGKPGKRQCKNPPPPPKEPCETLEVAGVKIDYKIDDLPIPLLAPIMIARLPERLPGPPIRFPIPAAFILMDPLFGQYCMGAHANGPAASKGA